MIIELELTFESESEFVGPVPKVTAKSILSPFLRLLFTGPHLHNLNRQTVYTMVISGYTRLFLNPVQPPKASISVATDSRLFISGPLH